MYMYMYIVLLTQCHTPQILHVSSAGPERWPGPYHSHQTEQSPSPAALEMDEYMSNAYVHVSEYDSEFSLLI